MTIYTPESYHEFFTASAGVAGALVGLLFVAVSVTMERMEEQGETQIHRVRASTSLTAFSNALAISLFALVPGVNVGYAAFSVGVVGALFVIGALLSMLRLGLRRPGDLRGALFLVGLIIVLVFQLSDGVRLIRHPHHNGPYESIAILVVICFLLGISRAWELIGGPQIGVIHEMALFRRKHVKIGTGANADDSDQAADAGTPGDSSDSAGGSEPQSETSDRRGGEGASAPGS